MLLLTDGLACRQSSGKQKVTVYLQNGNPHTRSPLQHNNRRYSCCHTQGSQGRVHHQLRGNVYTESTIRSNRQNTQREFAQAVIQCSSEDCFVPNTHTELQQISNRWRQSPQVHGSRGRAHNELRPGKQERLIFKNTFIHLIVNHTKILLKPTHC